MSDELVEGVKQETQEKGGMSARRRALIGVGAVLLLCVCLGAIGALFGGGGDEGEEPEEEEVAAVEEE